MALPPLPDRIRADMFTHLSAMERAGLPPDKSFSLLPLPGNLQPRLTALRKLIAKGIDVPTAGLRSGLFSTMEFNILHAACSAGSPALSYTRLATRYEQKARQASLIKSRMIMPLLVLFIALAVQPLPALVAGSITGGQYVIFVVRPFILLAIIAGSCRYLWSWLSIPTDSPSKLKVSFSVFLTRIPLFGTILVRRNVRDFYENLALMLESGIPIFEALPKAVNTVNLCIIRSDFSRLKPAMERGLTLTQAVSDLQFQGRYSAHSFVNTGEASGNLPEMLLRYANGESEAVAQFQQQAADWLPRLFYGIVLGWMAYQILRQHATL